MSFHPKMSYQAAFHKSERELPEPGEPFAFTAENRARLEEIARRYPPERRKSAILPALYLVQAQQRYVTASAMSAVAEAIGCTAAEVEEVVQYYTMFFTRPVGTYVLQVCRTLSCALTGAERVTEALERKLGIKVGETDQTGTFTLIETECLGACDRGPVIMINDYWQERVRPESVGKLIDDLREKGPAALTGCHLEVERQVKAQG